jgi:hypothetical protein
VELQAVIAYTLVISLLGNTGLLTLLLRHRTSSRKERELSGQDRLSLSSQLHAALQELAVVRRIMKSRGRFIAKIKPLLKRSQKERELSEQDRLSLFNQLQAALQELAVVCRILESRGRLIAELKPQFKRAQGEAADHRGQNNVLEKHLRLVCEEVETQDAAKEQEAKADLGFEVARIVISHA